MIAADLLSEVVPAIHKNDTAMEALGWMDVFKVSHLPIVDHNTYLGIIADADIYDLNRPETSVMDTLSSIQRPFVKESQHIFEVAEVFSKHKLSVVPVLANNEEYLGLITVYDLSQAFAHLISTESPGGIIVLEVKTSDYSLSEIAQIIEGNDTKILSLYITSKSTNDHIDITIKVNKTDLSAVVQTFERYNYKIKEIHSENSELDSTLKDRLDSFLKYLNI